jgi:hypothetical protein
MRTRRAVQTPIWGGSRVGSRQRTLLHVARIFAYPRGPDSGVESDFRRARSGVRASGAFDARGCRACGLDGAQRVLDCSRVQAYQGSMPFVREQEEHRGTRPQGATDVDVERVALMLYNAKGSLVDAYDAIGNKERDIGPHFPFEEARIGREENASFSSLNRTGELLWRRTRAWQTSRVARRRRMSPKNCAAREKQRCDL